VVVALEALAVAAGLVAAAAIVVFLLRRE